MYRLRNSLIILISGMLITGSCKNLSKEDLSLTEKEYQKMGMPVHNKIWTNDDYINANITLSSLKINNPSSLPRKQSKKSGALFSRIVNSENLSFADDTTLSLRFRALQIQHFPRFQNELSNMYNYYTKDRKYYGEELIDTYIFGLYIQKKMLELAGKVMNSKDEADISMQSGLRNVQNNYFKLIYILLGEQIKSKVYPARDLDRLSIEVSRSLKDNLKWIEPAIRQKFIIQIEGVIEKSPSANVKKSYRESLKVLKNTN
jgi:hypothetical protein